MTQARAGFRLTSATSLHRDCMQRLQPVTSSDRRSGQCARADSSHLIASELRGHLEDAQHRFLEVLVRTHLDRGQGRAEAADPLLALCVGLSLARRTSLQGDTTDPTGAVFTALEELILAVRGELARACPSDRSSDRSSG
jgi:hypothetical protein